MADFTNYTEQAVRDWMSQGTAMDTAPDPIYVALHTADPGESPDGSTEVAATNYARESVAAGSGWGTYTNGDAEGFQNANEIAFSEASESWGDISHVTLWTTADTTGNCLASYALDSTVSIGSGDVFRFDAGQLQFEVN